jgi:hypothetical protein
MKFRSWLVVFLCVVSSVSCSRFFGPDGDIEYRVEGSATTADITYVNSTGATVQVLGAAVPWTFAWSDAKKGDLLSISAQIISAAGGTITVTVRTNGDEYKKASSSGLGGVATASGTYQP